MMRDESTFGVALTKCFWCGEGDRIIINTRLTTHLAKQVEEMDGKAIDKEPCPKCKDFMKMGIIVIAVRDGETGDNPYRTGGWWVVRDEAIRRMFKSQETIDSVLKMRICFLGETVARNFGSYEESKETG